MLCIHLAGAVIRSGGRVKCLINSCVKVNMAALLPWAKILVQADELSSRLLFYDQHHGSSCHRNQRFRKILGLWTVKKSTINDVIGGLNSNGVCFSHKKNKKNLQKLMSHNKTKRCVAKALPHTTQKSSNITENSLIHIPRQLDFFLFTGK